MVEFWSVKLNEAISMELTPAEFRPIEFNLKFATHKLMRTCPKVLALEMSCGRFAPSIFT